MPAIEKKTNASQVAVFNGEGVEQALSEFIANGPAVFVFLRQFG